MASQSTMDKLHDMRLSVMARAYRDQEELPAASGLSFDERLAMIVDAEWDSRRTNKRLRHLRQAGFPEQDANIADVRYDDDRKLDRAQMVELSNCSWIASRRNIIVTGASGAGKTWISNALGVAACNAFYTVRYTRLPELLDELTVFKDEEWLKQRKKYIKCDLLIIDDLGTELTNSFVSSQLFLCINERIMRRKSTIISTNLKLENFSDTYSERTFSRIASNYRMVKLEGKDIRIQKIFLGGK